MRALALLGLVVLVALAGAPAGGAGDGGSSRHERASMRDRVDDLQQELDSLIEDVEDLQEPVDEFELFDQCMYLIGVSEFGKPDGSVGYWYGPGGRARRPALAMDIRGFGRPRYQFLAFPGEEPPSIECNEDAGQEFVDG